MLLTRPEEYCEEFYRHKRLCQAGALDIIDLSQAIKAGYDPPLLKDMPPKIQAAIGFVRSGPGRTALIGSPDKALQAICGENGTLITA